MAHGEYAECPQCGIVAFGHDEIEEVFGYRYGGSKPQSWCKACRSTGNDSNERLSAYDAALIWQSYGRDEDYTFGYSEDELLNALD